MSNRIIFNLKNDLEEQEKKSDTYHCVGDFHCRYWKYVEKFLPVGNNYEGIIKQKNTESIINDIQTYLRGNNFIVRLTEDKKEIYNTIISENRLINQTNKYKIILNEHGVSIINKDISPELCKDDIHSESHLFQAKKFTVYTQEKNLNTFICDDTSNSWSGNIYISNDEKEYLEYEVKQPKLSNEESEEILILIELKNLLRKIKEHESVFFYLET